MDGQILWVIKGTQDQIIGPLTTQKVLEYIARGVFSGQELVAKYPGGNWIEISQEPAFFDELLSAIEPMNIRKKPERPVSPPKIVNQNNNNEESTIKKSFQQKEAVEKTHQDRNQEVILENDNSLEIKNSKNYKDLKKKDSKKRKNRKKETVIIELADLQKIREVRKKRLQKVIFYSLIGLLIVVVFVVFTEQKKETHIHLIGPEKKSQHFSENEQNQRLRLAVMHFSRHTFSGYVKAQNQLVGLIEGAEKNLQARGLLCLTYLELWPYAYKDSSDSRVVSKVVQETQMFDPVGLFGSQCQLSKLMIEKRFFEAQGLIDQVLNQHVNNGVLYLLKAQLLAIGGDYTTAIAYVQKTQSLWARWLKSFILEAKWHEQIGNVAQSAKVYRAVLKDNPNYGLGKLRLGVLEYKEFKHEKIALDLIESAINLDDRLPKLDIAEGSYVLAKIYLKSNQREQALKNAKKAYTLNATNKQYQELMIQLGGREILKKTKLNDSEIVLIGDQYMLSGDYFAAQAEYKAAFEVDGRNVYAAKKAAECLWELGQSKEAIDWLNKAIRADSQYISAYVLLADYYSQRYNFLSAAQVLNRAKQIQPNSYELDKGFAMIELRRQNPQGALGFAQKALKQYDTDIEILLLLAQSHRQLREYTKSLRYAVRALELESTHVGAKLEYARIISDYQGIDSAVRFVQDLINKYEHILEYRIELAHIYYADDNYEKARIYYQSVVDIQPKNKEALIGLARALQKLSYNDEALSTLLSAASIDPSDAEPLFLTGQLYFDMNRPHLAIRQFERVLKINPYYPRVNYFIGLSALVLSPPNIGKAIRHAMDERKINPKLVDAYLLAGEAYSLDKQYTKCAEEYQKAIGLRPQGAKVYVQMARCYRLSGNISAARSMLNLAVQKESGYSDIYKELGAVYEMLGQNEEAVIAYRKYLSLSPNAVDASNIQQKMNSL